MCCSIIFDFSILEKMGNSRFFGDECLKKEGKEKEIARKQNKGKEMKGKKRDNYRKENRANN